MLTPEQLQATFERERRFRSAILDAAKASQPKQPGLLAGLAIFITKTIPPQVVSKAIENAGRVIIGPQQDFHPPEESRVAAADFNKESGPRARCFLKSKVKQGLFIHDHSLSKETHPY